MKKRRRREEGKGTNCYFKVGYTTYHSNGYGYIRVQIQKYKKDK